MARVRKSVCDKRERELLHLIWRAAGESQGEAVLPTARLARDLGVTACRIRGSVMSLVAEGSLLKCPRFSDDGAQLANAYSLTVSGMRRLENEVLRQQPAGEPAAGVAGAAGAGVAAGVAAPAGAAGAGVAAGAGAGAVAAGAPLAAKEGA